MSIKRTLETNAQLAEAGKPSMRAFDHPAMTAGPVVLLDATASDPRTDASLTQVLPTVREVVSLICMKLVGAASRTTTESRHARDGINERFEHHRVVPIGARDHQHQRHAAPVYDEMSLAAKLAAIRWVRPGLLAPGDWRRQHVIPLPKPSSLGRSSHGIPVCRTNRMPFSAARSSMRG